jgi:hypothetical protein
VRRLVVRDDHPRRLESREPRLDHLAVDEPVVDAKEGDHVGLADSGPDGSDPP